MGACSSVKNVVANTCGSNPGGQRKLYVIASRDVVSIPDVAVAGELTIEDDIVLASGKKFAVWDFAKNTAEGSYNLTGNQGNQSWNQGIEFQQNGSDPVADAVINAAANGEFICLLADGLGQVRLYGEIDNPLMFVADYKSGKKGGDPNVKTSKFTGEGFADMPKYYTGAISVLT